MNDVNLDETTIDAETARIEKLSESTQKLCECISGLELQPAAIIDVMAVVMAEVIARSSTDRASVEPVLNFVNNRVNQMIDLYEEAGLPEWAKKANA